MDTLGIERDKTRLSLTTLSKQNCIMNCNLFSQELFDLDENYFVDLPSVFSVPSLPMSSDSIPTLEDVISFPNLRDLQIQTIDSNISLLIGCDVQRPWKKCSTRCVSALRIAMLSASYGGKKTISITTQKITKCWFIYSVPLNPSVTLIWAQSR